VVEFLLAASGGLTGEISRLLNESALNNTRTRAVACVPGDC
jgi:hypothetical protein